MHGPVNLGGRAAMPCMRATPTFSTPSLPHERVDRRRKPRAGAHVAVMGTNTTTRGRRFHAKGLSVGEVEEGQRGGGGGGAAASHGYGREGAGRRRRRRAQSGAAASGDGVELACPPAPTKTRPTAAVERRTELFAGVDLDAFFAAHNI
ncbi:hypothetical protein E2562_013299 [Oryza meyeriana var. granulata]|uniref:Uncharacterized protein n=1 Tax=Oryza meyeriana var. granulata TaxID=110450 RepID=A0A6G1D1Z9_9ORYZ|nr:hypothetical protein E2562_013299 [Oryza meyeriana var. granulata]